MQDKVNKISSKDYIKPQVKFLFIECTFTYNSNLNTGVQRVVKNIIQNASSLENNYGLKVVPVIFQNKKLVLADLEFLLSNKPGISKPSTNSGYRKLVNLYHHFLKIIAYPFYFQSLKNFIRAPKENYGPSWLIYSPVKVYRCIRGKLRKPSSEMSLDDIIPHENNILLLLDSSWGIPLWEAVNRFKSCGGFVVTTIYDLIPLNFPEFCPPELSSAFQKWLRVVTRSTDALISISKSVQLDTENYLLENSNKEILTDYFYLGSEVNLERETRLVKDEIKGVFNENTYITVGTVEPRKNQRYILDAFEILWSKGSKARLIIIGRIGFNGEVLARKITAHPAYNTKLFMFNDASDADLCYCYEHSQGLITASKAEGFGLPIVEAIQKGLPVLCSDIPVFREIGRNKALYFDLNSPRSLCVTIENMQTPFIRELGGNILSWEESSTQLIEKLIALRQVHFCKE